MQDALFGAAWDEGPAQERADATVRLSALNVQGGSPTRVLELMKWLLSTDPDVVVLSEVRAANADRLAAELRALGYDTGLPSADDSRGVLTATRQSLSAVHRQAMSRVNMVTVEVGQHTLTVVGVYAPTNGMSAESSATRRVWQSQFLQFTTGLDVTGPLLVTGDLNVLEPGHVPASPYFEEHDYDFYRGLVGLGHRDCYRLTQPEGTEHSWSSPRFGAQRLDHTFVSESHVAAVVSCAYDGRPVREGFSDHQAMVTELDQRKF